jgi:AP2 domain/HNH endonuclease
MREITLTKGFVALVDDGDYERINAVKWYALVHRRTVYATRKPKEGHFMMHRVIMGITDPKIHVDHRDFNGLNNTRANLRVCTNQENHYGMRKMRRAGTSKYKGVSWFARDGNWMSHIKRNQKSIHLGYFATEEEAARRYDDFAWLIFGEFCHLNFPLPESVQTTVPK